MFRKYNSGRNEKRLDGAASLFFILLKSEVKSNDTKQEKMSVDNRIKWKMLHAKVFELRIRETFEVFRQNRIEPILIKGWAAGLNYPNCFERIYTDIDLAVSADDYRKALEIAGGHRKYIDIHRGLRHLDTVDWRDLFENSELISSGGDGDGGAAAIRVLRPEDHLRVLCVHWLNDGGAYKERLWDIYYAVENRRADFDWERCLGIIDKKRETWILCVLGLAERYLGLNLEDTPVAGRTQNIIPGWVIKTVVREWNTQAKLKPLETVIGSKKDLCAQIKLRLPPNPIQSTIEMEGDFNSGSRIPYQIGGMLLRLKILTGRLMKYLSRRRQAVKQKNTR